ncbi:MAG: hypothetical protein U0230_23130 [Polyangiales bacterium]
MLRALVMALLLVGGTAAGVVASAGSASSAARSDSSEALSAQERSALVAGRLIVRPRTERRGDLRLLGGTSFQVVNLPPDRVFRALQDPNHLWRMLPSARESRIARGGPNPVLYVRHALGPVSASYYLRARYQPQSTTVTFQLAPGMPNDVRAGWGYLKVRPFQGGRSLLSFGAMIDLGDGLLADAAKPRIHQWLLRIPSTMKRYLERRARASRP